MKKKIFINKISKLKERKGIVLIFALILLLAVTVIAIGAAQTQTLEERMALNIRDRQIAMQSGEAALRDAESGLLQGLYVNFPSNTAGQYTYQADLASPYLSINWSNSSQVLPYTGPTISGVVQQPNVVIEEMPSVAVPGQSISSAQYGAGTPPVKVYRVTSFAMGGDTNSSIELQSIFR